MEGGGGKEQRGREREGWEGVHTVVGRPAAGLGLVPARGRHGGGGGGGGGRRRGALGGLGCVRVCVRVRVCVGGCVCVFA